MKLGCPKKDTWSISITKHFLTVIYPGFSKYGKRMRLGQKAVNAQRMVFVVEKTEQGHKRGQKRF